MLKEFLRRIAFVGIIFVVIFGFIGYKDALIAFSKPVDINVDYPDDYEGVKAVKTEFDMILDLFASEETTTTNESGAITNRRYDYYYVVPVYIESEDDPYFVGVKVPSKDKKTYDKVCDATWEYVYGEIDELETVEFEGGFYKMEDEAYKYFKEWFEDNEWFEDEKDMKKYVLPLMLEPLKISTVRTATFVCVGVLALCIFLLVLSFRKGKEKPQSVTPQKAVITINDINYPTSNFEKVNKLVEKGKKDKAVKELMEVTGISETAANAVILDWYAYWC